MVRKGTHLSVWAGMAAALAVASSTAVAQGKASLVVAPLSQGDNVPPGSGARFAQQLAEELQGRDELRLVTPPKPAPAPAPAAATPKGANPEKAAAQLAEGAKQLESLHFDQAVTALKSGIELTLLDPARADLAKVLDAYVQLAAASFRLGDDKGVQSALYEVARLEPGYKVPERYPPVFVREFEKAKKKVEKAPRAKLVVEGPPGATGFIDGRDLGMVAVDEEVPAGKHYVKVEGTRGELFGQVVEVKGAPVTVKAVFPGGGAVASAAPEEPKVFGTVDADVLAKVAAYSKATNAELVLFGMLYRSSEHQLTAATALYSAAKAGVVALTPVTVDRELLTSKVEAFKVADEVLARVTSFGTPAALPLTLGGKSVRVAVTPTAQKPVNDDVQVSAPRLALKPAAPAPEPTEVRLIGRAPPPAPEREPRVASQGVRWYWWVLGGVAVAAAAGGTVYGVTQATRPVTGTASASW